MCAATFDDSQVIFLGVWWCFSATLRNKEKLQVGRKFTSSYHVMCCLPVLNQFFELTFLGIKTPPRLRCTSSPATIQPFHSFNKLSILELLLLWNSLRVSPEGFRESVSGVSARNFPNRVLSIHLAQDGIDSTTTTTSTRLGRSSAAAAWYGSSTSRLSTYQ